MRALPVLPLLLVAMTCQTAAQTISDAATSAPAVIRDDGRATPHPIEGKGCGPWLQGCQSEDRDRVLLFLSVVGGGKRPLILR